MLKSCCNKVFKHGLLGPRCQIEIEYPNLTQKYFLPE